MTRRHVTAEQSHHLMSYTCERLAPVLSKFRRWELRADSPVPRPENHVAIYIQAEQTLTCPRIFLIEDLVAHRRVTPAVFVSRLRYASVANPMICELIAGR